MQFKDVEFMTAKEKELTLKAWERFFKNGLQFKDFTDRLYKHLSLHCSFIAHYDRAGFYATYFEEPEDTLKFLSQFDNDTNHISIEYGMTYWYTASDYSDLNKAMCDVLDKYKLTLYGSLKAEQTRLDVARAKVLLEKHGIRL